MARLTVLFDGHCALCSASARRVRRFDSRGRVELLDLHDPSARRRFPHVDRDQAMKWMLAVDAQGKTYQGADAWAQIGALLSGWNLLAWILRVPGIHWLATRMYAWIARNRYRWNRTVCKDDSCGVHLGRLRP